MNAMFNFVLFQITWFACVLGAAKQQPWLGVAVSIAFMLYFVFTSFYRTQAIKLLAWALMIGVVFDAIAVHVNWVRFEHMPFWSAALAPAWMLALWGNLAATLNSSLAWLQGKLALAALFGAVGGPLAYFAGQKLGALQITHPLLMTIYLSLGWAIIMPFLFYLSRSKSRFTNTKYADSGVA